MKRHRPAPRRRQVRSAKKPRPVGLKSKPQTRWVEGQAKVAFEGKCRRCHGRGELHPHHIVHRGSPFRGDDQADNCCPLCAGCHRVWHDTKGFDIWRILTTAEKRHAIEQLGDYLARELLIPSRSEKRVAA